MICFLKALPSNRLPTNGAKRSRTADPYHAMVVLYQLSYNPVIIINLQDRVPCCQYPELMECGLLAVQLKSKHNH
jgi:hypothetical protein